MIHVWTLERAPHCAHPRARGCRFKFPLLLSKVDIMLLLATLRLTLCVLFVAAVIFCAFVAKYLLVPDVTTWFSASLLGTGLLLAGGELVGLYGTFGVRRLLHFHNLLVLWILAIQFSFIAGVYLNAESFARFVQETSVDPNVIQIPFSEDHLWFTAFLNVILISFEALCVGLSVWYARTLYKEEALLTLIGRSGRRVRRGKSGAAYLQLEDFDDAEELEGLDLLVTVGDDGTL